MSSLIESTFALESRNKNDRALSAEWRTIRTYVYSTYIV